MYVLQILTRYSESEDIELVREFIFDNILLDKTTLIAQGFDHLSEIVSILSNLEGVYSTKSPTVSYLAILSERKILTESKEIKFDNYLAVNDQFSSDAENLYFPLDLDDSTGPSQFDLFKEFQTIDELFIRFEGVVLGKKTWFKLTKFEKKCWLKLASSKYEGNIVPLKDNIILDGKYLLCEEDLYCYLGEEVCGILGYVGYNLNALADVIVDLNLSIEWINFEYSKNNFDSIEYLDYLVEILEKYASLKIID